MVAGAHLGAPCRSAGAGAAACTSATTRLSGEAGAVHRRARDRSFWAPRIEINRTVTIPFAFGKNEETGRVDNFERAAAVLQGHPPADRKPPGYPFDDTDIYKVLEGASYTLSVTAGPEARRRISTG